MPGVFYDLVFSNAVFYTGADDMADDVIYGAIKDYVSANWTNTTIAWENEDFSRPEPPAPFIIFEITGTYYQQETIGDGTQANNRWDEEGVMFFHVLVPTGAGSMLARHYCKAIANLFRGLLLLDDNLEFMRASIGEGAPSDDAGMYWRTTVSVEWYMTDSH